MQLDGGYFFSLLGTSLNTGSPVLRRKLKPTSHAGPLGEEAQSQLITSTCFEMSRSHSGSHVPGLPNFYVVAFQSSHHSRLASSVPMPQRLIARCETDEYTIFILVATPLNNTALVSIWTPRLSNHVRICKSQGDEATRLAELQPATGTISPQENPATFGEHETLSKRDPPCLQLLHWRTTPSTS